MLWLKKELSLYQWAVHMKQDSMSKKVEGPHEDLTYRIIGAAMKVHSRLGPGHKEEVYQRALEAQSLEDGLVFEAQKLLEVYDNDLLVGYYIPDFIYEEKVVVEIKAFSSLSRRYLGQVVTYLNHTGLQVGLLLNFGERRMIPRRVFPSSQAAEFSVQYQWVFIPDWLRADRAAHPPAPSVASVSSVSRAPALPAPPAAPPSVASVSSVSRTSVSRAPALPAPSAAAPSVASVPSVSSAPGSSLPSVPPPPAAAPSVASVSSVSSAPGSSLPSVPPPPATPPSVASVPSVSSVPGSSLPSVPPPPPAAPSVASVSSVSRVPGSSLPSVPPPPATPPSVASVSSVSGRLIAALRLDGFVTDVRVSTHWTAVVVDTSAGTRAGLASTQLVHDLEHGQPAVREAGRLIGKPAADVAALARSDSPTERSIGFAAINALLEVDETACVDRNAEDLILERGAGRKVAIVGHFPFVPKVREVAEVCWVLELSPGPDDLPADMAPEIIPQADVVAITGMALVNGTFEALAALTRPDAFVVVLGASTPLSPILFDYGVDAISSTVITDIPLALTAVSQGANFRQIQGKRLLTMARRKAKGEQ